MLAYHYVDVYQYNMFKFILVRNKLKCLELAKYLIVQKLGISTMWNNTF